MPVRVRPSALQRRKHFKHLKASAFFVFFFMSACLLPVLILNSGYFSPAPPLDIPYALVYYSTMSLVHLAFLYHRRCQNSRKRKRNGLRCRNPHLSPGDSGSGEKIIQGKLKPGDRLPSGRELAVLYKINHNTAARIYRELEDMGYCFTRRGIGTFVSEDEAVFRTLKQERAEQLLGSFMEEMKALGFEKKDILSMVSGYL